MRNPHNPTTNGKRITMPQTNENNEAAIMNDTTPPRNNPIIGMIGIPQNIAGLLIAL